MNAITLPDDPELTEWLSRRAAKHGASPAEEAAAILRAQKAREMPAEPRDPAAEMAKWQALFAMAIKLPPGAPDSTDLIREDRDSR